MAVSSARGYVQVQKQSALGTPAAMDSGRRAFSYRNSPRAGGEVTNTRYRESSSGLEVGLSLKEGIRYLSDFEILARPTTLAYLASAAMGPRSDQGKLGGGSRANGLVRPPVLAAGGGNTTISAVAKPGDTTITVGSITNFAVTDKIVIGWGANMEFITLHGATAPSGSTITLLTALKFPHSVGEPVYEVNGYTTVNANYVAGGATSLVVVDQTGFPASGTIAIGAMQLAGYEGSEFGQMEEFAYSAKVSTTSFTVTAGTHEHSIGAWVWEADTAGFTTSRIHGFEPVSRLGSLIDFFTVERAVGNLVIERMHDGPLGNFTLSGESPGPLTLQTGFRPRSGKMKATASAEDYSNQGADDIPFRMPDGKYVIAFNSSVVSSDQIRQFELNQSNIIVDDIFTDDIIPNDILPVAKESNLGAQFFFKNGTDYREFIYSSQADDTDPSRVAATGYFLANFTISTTKRLCIYVPRIVWEAYPVNPDAEPKAIIVEATGAPLKLSNRPSILVALQNADTTAYA